MTIDESIEQEKFKARVDRIKSNKKIFHNNDEDKISACHRSAEEHEQIADWLEELKVYQQHEIICNKGYNAGYNKAIDDFAENISLEISESLIWGMIADCFKYKNLNDTSDKIVDYVINTANEIAEQLKAGGKDD